MNKKNLNEISCLTDPTITEPTPLEAESKIFKTLWELKKSGYAQSTIETTSQRLKTICKFVDLDDPEEVRGWIANHECSIGYKCGLVDSYERYVRCNDLEWSKPNYKREDPIIARARDYNLYFLKIADVVNN